MTSQLTRTCRPVLILIALVTSGPGAFAGDGPWEAGLRASALSGGGSPTADMPSYGLLLRRSTSDGWRFAVAVDREEFDFEVPTDHLGLEEDFSQAEPADSLVQGFLVSVLAERDFSPPGARVVWFARGGIGVAFTSADDAQGALVGGGTFDIQTDIGTYVVPTVGGGLRVSLGRSWGIELEARLDYHLADWQVVDRVSGASTTIEPFAAAGGSLTLTHRF